mmetsp:Transcript_11557/g.33222  ORF Transcript_11557/g.33222 Transcript_11557/m.33222 type:complete len:210 (+) Transcript_11557:1132-1761(+)
MQRHFFACSKIDRALSLLALFLLGRFGGGCRVRWRRSGGGRSLHCTCGSGDGGVASLVECHGTSSRTRRLAADLVLFDLLHDLTLFGQKCIPLFWIQGGKNILVDLGFHGGQRGRRDGLHVIQRRRRLELLVSQQIEGRCRWLVDRGRWSSHGWRRCQRLEWRGWRDSFHRWRRRGKCHWCSRRGLLDCLERRRRWCGRRWRGQEAGVE